MFRKENNVLLVIRRTRLHSFNFNAIGENYPRDVYFTNMLSAIEAPIHSSQSDDIMRNMEGKSRRPKIKKPHKSQFSTAVLKISFLCCLAEWWCIYVTSLSSLLTLSQFPQSIVYIKMHYDFVNKANLAIIQSYQI